MKRRDEPNAGELNIERRIIIGLISSTVFLKRITTTSPPCNPTKLLKAKSAAMLSSWVMEHFEKYGKAPGEDIEAIYFEKLREGYIDKDLAEDIEDDIRDLSHDSEEQGEDPFLMDLAFKYFHDRFQDLQLEKLNEVTPEEFQELYETFAPLKESASVLDGFMLTLEDMKKLKIEKPKLFLSPWLRAGETNWLYSDVGVGKSLFAVLLAYLLAVEEEDREECEIAGWQVKQSVGTVYVDGEMGQGEMKDRLDQYSWLGAQKPGYETIVMSLPYFQAQKGQDFNLSERSNQSIIIEWLESHPNYKFLIIDSVSTVFGLENENDNSEFNNKVGPFLKDLRGLGVAHLVQHHQGKDGKLRGATAMQTMAHNIFKLTDHPNKEKGEAWFKVSNADKQRASGKRGVRDFYMHFEDQGTLKKAKTVWEVEIDGEKSKPKSGK